VPTHACKMPTIIWHGGENNILFLVGKLQYYRGYTCLRCDDSRPTNARTFLAARNRYLISCTRSSGIGQSSREWACRRRTDVLVYKFSWYLVRPILFLKPRHSSSVHETPLSASGESVVNAGSSSQPQVHIWNDTDILPVGEIRKLTSEIRKETQTTANLTTMLRNLGH
jgi:hypothetical protein